MPQLVSILPRKEKPWDTWTELTAFYEQLPLDRLLRLQRLLSKRLQHKLPLPKLLRPRLPRLQRLLPKLLRHKLLRHKLFRFDLPPPLPSSVPAISRLPSRHLRRQGDSREPGRFRPIRRAMIAPGG